MTPDEIYTRLARIEDPKLGNDIVSLGVVDDVTVEPDVVRVRVTLHAPYAPDEEWIAERIREELSDIDREIDLTVPPLPVSDAERPLPSVKNIIAVSSGKGGVGKTTVAVNTAQALAERGARVGLLDADLYGPNVPRMLGDGDGPTLNDETETLTPPERGGIKVMSLGFLVPEKEAAVMRGPMIDSTLERLLVDVEWGELDYLIVDLPPGTGDAQLTLCQTVPLTGAVVVTTPQAVSTDDAHRALHMFGEQSIPVLGIVENMSGFTCPSCGDTHDLFGRGGGKTVAEEYDLPFLGSVPIDPEIRETADDDAHVGTLGEDDTDEAFRDIAGDIANGIGTLRRRGVPN
ncbi:P-loop NTPase [Halorubrum sp. DTA98]|uniref:Mrp/NBP35 family ATP-binding protein n=1 Tax=Halorubrum sp. DTA98 TaxID=3402163 RepID=UPI003AAED6F6